MKITPVDLLAALVQWILVALVKILGTVSGLIIVPIALQFKEADKTTETPFTQHNTDKNWWHVGLPKWAWLWSNDRDGAKGDKRGWWDREAGFKWDKDSDSFIAQFWWLAIRNPANNLRFVRGIAVNMYESTVYKLAGHDIVDDEDSGQYLGNWHFLMTQGPKFKYYTFKWYSKPWLDWVPHPWFKNRVIHIYLGHKCKLDYNEEFPNDRVNEASDDSLQRAWKGATVRFNPFLDFIK